MEFDRSAPIEDRRTGPERRDAAVRAPSTRTSVGRAGGTDGLQVAARVAGTSNVRVQRVSTGETIQRKVVVDVGEGAHKTKSNGDLRKLIGFLDGVNEAQVGHAGYAQLSAADKLRMLSTAVDSKADYRFEYVTENRPNPSTGANEAHWWKVVTPVGTSYHLYSYEGWPQVFDAIFTRAAAPQAATKTVELTWTCGAKTRAKVEAYRQLVERLTTASNYHDRTGEPMFNNSHIDDTRTAQWKLQADVVEMGGGSTDRLHINVSVEGDTITVDVIELSLKTH